MKLLWIFFILGKKLLSESVEWISVKQGDAVSVHCNMSFNLETVWVRQKMDSVPERLLVSGPNEHDGSVYSKNILDPRFSAAVNHSSQTNSLQIRDIGSDDLALYYCIGRVRGQLAFGVGTRLYLVTAELDIPKSVLVLPYTWFVACIGVGLLIMVAVVLAVHLKTRQTQTVRQNSSFKSEQESRC